MSKKTVKIVRKPRLGFDLNVPCNVKVQGERTMRKNVVLVRHPDDPSLLVVKTGRRGRPGFVPVSEIVKVRSL